MIYEHTYIMTLVYIFTLFHSSECTSNHEAKLRGIKPEEIELVIVLVILGILAAVVVPRFTDLSADALDAAKKGQSGAVKSAHAIAIAENSGDVTVTQIAAQLPGSTAVATGIQVSIDGNSHIAPTYTDSGCSSATSAVGDTVLCVGDIP